MKNKLLWSIGSLGFISTPILTIVSCSPGSNMGKEESLFLESLKSNNGVRKINNMWLDKALKQLYSNDSSKIQADLEKYIEFFMAEEIRKDNYYLTNLNKEWAVELSGNEHIEKRNKLSVEYQMGNYYKTFEEWTKEFTSNKKFSDFIDEYLFDDNDPLGVKHQIPVKTDFLVNAKKALIVKKYLGIKKTDWMAVFGNEDEEKLYDSALDSDQDVWDIIDDNEFPLVLEGMRKHYAYSWNIQVKEEDEVYEFLEKTETYPDAKPGENKVKDITAEFDEIGKLGKLSTYNESLHKADDKYSVLDISATSPLAKYVGYDGIVTLPQGKGSLNFEWNSKDNWTSKTDPEAFDGFVEKEKLKRGDDIIKYAEQSAKEINLTLFNGNYLIPTYNQTEKKIKFAISDNDKKENLYWTFINQNETLYEKAIQYYTNKENPIQLDASGDKFIEKQLMDIGIEFLKKSE